MVLNRNGFVSICLNAPTLLSVHPHPCLFFFFIYPLLSLIVCSFIFFLFPFPRECLQ
ncbi:hypothetical protein BGZ63DRAFT_396714 [Mariannaea sp. PMI_226]|nr:hypothetical protein BGZ63DRAFT_396714 [Mariannaea sp. PMI_226]